MARNVIDVARIKTGRVSNAQNQCNTRVNTKPRPLPIIIVMTFFCVVIMLTSKAARADLYDSRFYDGVKKIVITSVTRVHEKEGNGLIEKMHRIFDSAPIISSHALGSLSEKALLAAIDKKTHIEIIADNKFEDHYFTMGITKDRDGLSLLTDVQFWNKDEFQPALNYDIALIQVRVKRNVVTYDAHNNPSLGVHEKYLPDLLVSLPDSQEKIGIELQQRLTTYFLNNLWPVNCANGGHCKN